MSVESHPSEGFGARLEESSEPARLDPYPVHDKFFCLFAFLFRFSLFLLDYYLLDSTLDNSLLQSTEKTYEHFAKKVRPPDRTVEETVWQPTDSGSLASEGARPELVATGRTRRCCCEGRRQLEHCLGGTERPDERRRVFAPRSERRPRR